MIQIQTRRAWLLAIAVTVNDDRIATVALGLTQEGASRRLLRKLDGAW